MSLRRGACPTLSEPMQTGDGLLVRINPVDGRLTAGQLGGLARAAQRFGNGILEITARGNLQIRGLTAASAVGLGAEVESLGIAVRDGLPLDVNPLAGLDAQEIADPRPLAREISERCEALGLNSRLGPKVSVTVDGRGALGLGGLLADVKLEAVAPSPTRFAELAPDIAVGGSSPLPSGGEVDRAKRETVRGSGTTVSASHIPNWLIRVGGTSATARMLGEFSQADAAEITIRILQVIAERGNTARARDLSDEELAAITGRQPSREKKPMQADGLPVGLFATLGTSGAGLPSPLRGRIEGGGQREAPLGKDLITPAGNPPTSRGRMGPEAAAPYARGFALAYGQIESAALAAFADALGEQRELRLARGRGLIVLDVKQDEDAALVAAAQSCGLVTSASDPRLSVAACAGKPACASAHLATKRIADRLIARRPELIDGSFTLHLSGCEKQCARPSGPAVTLIGSKGSYDIRAESAAISPDLKAALSALAEEQIRQNP